MSRGGVRGFALLGCLGAVGFAASLSAGAAPPKPKLTKAQRACAVRTIGAAATARYVHGRSLTAKQRSKLAACLKKKPANPGPRPAPTAPPGAWLTAAPFDLALVTEISRFRSCTGHDFSGTDIDGQIETARSMKHYVRMSIAWTPADAATLYAPFDGTVAIVRTGGKPGQAVDILSDAGKPWMFFFAHVTPLVRVGDRVKAGDPVATVPPADAHELGARLPPTVNFDTGLESVADHGPAYESFFLHMTDKLLGQFAARGFTPKNMVVSKEARDDAPCTDYNRSDAVDYVRASG